MADEKQLIDIEALSHYHAKSKIANDSTYVAKEEGKGLSQENYTTVEKQQLAALVAGGIPEGGGGSGENEIVIVGVETFNEETMTGTISQETADILQNYSGEKPTYVNVMGMYIPFNGGENLYHTIGTMVAMIYIDYADLTFSCFMNEVLPLNEDGKIDSTYIPKLTIDQMPDLGFYDDVVEGYLKPDDGLFYKEYGDYTSMGGGIVYNYPITGESGKIYLDLHTNNTYRWGGTQYVRINPDEYTVATNADIDALFT